MGRPLSALVLMALLLLAPSPQVEAAPGNQGGFAACGLRDLDAFPWGLRGMPDTWHLGWTAGWQRVGEWAFFHDHAGFEPAAVGHYRRGEPHGRWVFFHEDGSPAAEGSYRFGDRHGLWTFWDRAGRVAHAGRYAGGRLEGSWAHQADAAEGSWLRDCMHGEWRLRRPDGGVDLLWFVRGRLSDRPTSLDAGQGRLSSK